MRAISQELTRPVGATGDVVGERVSVRTDDRKNRYKGLLLEAGEDGITLETGDAGEIRIPYDAIVRANLIDEGLTT